MSVNYIKITMWESGKADIGLCGKRNINVYLFHVWLPRFYPISPHCHSKMFVNCVLCQMAAPDFPLSSILHLVALVYYIFSVLKNIFYLFIKS